jgi:hypothetical protein
MGRHEHATLLDSHEVERRIYDNNDDIGAGCGTVLVSVVTTVVAVDVVFVEVADDEGGATAGDGIVDNDVVVDGGGVAIASRSTHVANLLCVPSQKGRLASRRTRE